LEGREQNDGLQMVKFWQMVFHLLRFHWDSLGGTMEEIRNEVKINYRFNLCKLITLRALNLKGGWHDVDMICQLTGRDAVQSPAMLNIGAWT
jgi:hypothetical protein